MPQESRPKSFFLHPTEQFTRFLVFRSWLANFHPEYTIAERDIDTMRGRLDDLGEGDLLFYCFQFDVILTAKLAWEYLSSLFPTFLNRKAVRFDDQYLALTAGEPFRREGFYTKRLPPPDDEQGVGVRLLETSVQGARGELKCNGSSWWGMAFEGIQLLLTHPHYFLLLGRGHVPFIDLPGFAVAPAGDGDFTHAPAIGFLPAPEFRLVLSARPIEVSSNHHGSGVLC